VAQDFSGMGQAAVDLLDKVIENPQRRSERLLLATKLVAGDTVKTIG
jgi:DNA-binding LacI/PurR family transcriptional regulator